MKIIETDFNGLYLIEFHSVIDDRGFFLKPWVRSELKPFFGDNIETYFSSSEKGTLRGLHYQIGSHAQDKFVVCISGNIIDLAVDLRKESDTYGETFRYKLSNKSYGVIVPKGFAHGIYAESDAIITNFCSAPYSPKHEKGINWSSIKGLNDLNVTKLSDKDSILPNIEDILNE